MRGPLELSLNVFQLQMELVFDSSKVSSPWGLTSQYQVLEIWNTVTVCRCLQEMNSTSVLEPLFFRLIFNTWGGKKEKLVGFPSVKLLHLDTPTHPCHPSTPATHGGWAHRRHLFQVAKGTKVMKGRLTRLWTPPRSTKLEVSSTTQQTYTRHCVKQCRDFMPIPVFFFFSFSF